MTSEVFDAYSSTADAWQAGPGAVYDRLSAVAVGHSPVAPAGRAVLDLGAGTGAASRAALAAGASRVVAVDAALGMLSHEADHRPPAVAGDALALPFASGGFDVVVAAFSLNHLTEPAAGLAEARRVTRPGGAVVVASYSVDDAHPVKAAVEAALRSRGWEAQPWFAVLKSDAIPKLGTVDAVTAAAEAAGLRADVVGVRVRFPDLDAAALVAWRLGLAQHAPFVAQLTAAERNALVADAVENLGADCPPLERSVLIATAIV